MEKIKLSDILKPKQESQGINPLQIIQSLKELAMTIKEMQQLQTQPKSQVVENQRVENMNVQKIDKEKGFDMIIKALKMAIKFYGDVPASEFIEKLEKDKDKILKFVKL